MNVPKIAAIHAASFVLALIVAPATAQTRAKYSIKASDWLFTDADKARVDDLTQQAASRWNVLGDAQTSRKFKDVDQFLRSRVGSLENLSGRIDIWKPGSLVKVADGRDKRDVSFIQQTEFRVRDTSLGKVTFYETRNLRCMKAQDDRACNEVALEVWHYAVTGISYLPPLVQLNTSQTCNVTGKAGVTNWKGHSSVKCKAASEKRPIAINQSYADKLMPEYTRFDSGGEALIYGGEVAMEDKDGHLSFMYLLSGGMGTRLEGETSLQLVEGIVASGLYSFLFASPGRNPGDAPRFVMKEGEFNTRLDGTSDWPTKSLDFLCDKEWNSCIKDHIAGWTEQPNGRLRLDIDGCQNGICFKGAMYGTWMPGRANRAGGAP